MVCIGYRLVIHTFWRAGAFASRAKLRPLPWRTKPWESWRCHMDYWSGYPGRVVVRGNLQETSFTIRFQSDVFGFSVNQIHWRGCDGRFMKRLGFANGGISHNNFLSENMQRLYIHPMLSFLGWPLDVWDRLSGAKCGNFARALAEKTCAFIDVILPDWSLKAIQCTRLRLISRTVDPENWDLPGNHRRLSSSTTNYFQLSTFFDSTI